MRSRYTDPGWSREMRSRLHLSKYEMGDDGLSWDFPLDSDRKCDKIGAGLFCSRLSVLGVTG